MKKKIPKYKKVEKKKNLNKKISIDKGSKKSIEVPFVKSEVKKIISTDTSLPKKRRGRRSKDGTVASPNKMYFTQETEDSIILYNDTLDEKIKNEIYNDRIKYAFEKLVECIFNSFKFSYFDVSPLDIQKEVVSHLVSNINKFEKGKGKAYSYFSIIAKHYLIALNNSNYKRRNQHVEIGEEYEENTVQLQIEDIHHKKTEISEFMKLMIEFWENNIQKIFTKQKDLIIANAVIELFRNTDSLEIFNKKYLYLMIREISGCRTQQCTKILNKMKQYQNVITKSYLNEGVVNTKNFVKL